MSLLVSQTLMTGADAAEMVRDQVVDILTAEAANQRTLSPDPDLFTFTIERERSNPWEVFRDDAASAPVINVVLDNGEYQKAGSSQFQQVDDVTINIDCFATAATTAADPGDRSAALEAQRVARFVRRTMQASFNGKLQMLGTVRDRWVTREVFFQPIAGTQPVEHVMAARVVLTVQVNEEAPVYEGIPLKGIDIDGGLFRRSYNY